MDKFRVEYLVSRADRYSTQFTTSLGPETRGFQDAESAISFFRQLEGTWETEEKFAKNRTTPHVVAIKLQQLEDTPTGPNWVDLKKSEYRDWFQANKHRWLNPQDDDEVNENKQPKSNVIRLGESAFRQIVTESVKKALMELGGNGLAIKQLCFGLINGDIGSKVQKYEGDFEGSCDIIVSFDGGEINASCYEDGSEYTIASAEITWRGGTMYIDENDPNAPLVSKCITCLIMGPDL